MYHFYMISLHVQKVLSIFVIVTIWQFKWTKLNGNLLILLYSTLLYGLFVPGVDVYGGPCKTGFIVCKQSVVYFTVFEISAPVHVPFSDKKVLLRNSSFRTDPKIGHNIMDTQYMNPKNPAYYVITVISSCNISFRIKYCVSKK